MQGVSLNLGKAGEPVRISHTGDCIVEPGIAVEQGYMAPWLDTTLISLSKKLSEGYRFVAEGMSAVLISPTKRVYRYIVKDGLIVPDVDDGIGGHGTCEHGYTVKDGWEQQDIEYKAGKGNDIMTDRNVAISSALILAMTTADLGRK